MALHRRSVILALLAAPLARAAFAASPAASWSFPSIDGGTLDLADFRGGPVLVVNTASRCGSTPQYDGLQALWERYRDRGLTVVGVPSKSFGQELDSAAAVKDFCEVNFAIDFPMTGLVAVTGPDAHPFYVLGRQAGPGADLELPQDPARRRRRHRRRLRPLHRARRSRPRRRHRGAASSSNS